MGEPFAARVHDTIHPNCSKLYGSELTHVIRLVETMRSTAPKEKAMLFVLALGLVLSH
ncbi:hypothetical protein I6F20_01585 [Bradyrhizobium sp. IC3123]|uniref:hypothetical protein n=1 Tax=Bradyrhizobium sp. IC3123 TaxID=2793803 RepID=UPI001CD514FA|nr:hypothetical protein [Bradyrhizobium sp. IC3123]MCA1387751.1 hypothetical protein [Bradyrhizobium sp. IC3123]